MFSFTEIIQLISEDKVGSFDNERVNFIEKMIRNLSNYFSKDEELIELLPLTNESNTSIETSGWIGLSYATKPLSKKYTELFHDVRGNRLLLFTNKRIILLFPVEFLERESFKSYYYDSIPGIMIRKERNSFLDKLFKKNDKPRWYVIDFQGNSGIFSESLQPSQKEKFYKIISSIPQAKNIPVVNRIIRKNKFDQIVNNFEYVLRVGYFFNFLWILLFLLVLLGVFAGIGPFHYIQIFFK